MGVSASALTGGPRSQTHENNINERINVKKKKIPKH